MTNHTMLMLLVGCTLASTIPANAQEEPAVAFDPLTGLPIVAPQEARSVGTETIPSGDSSLAEPLPTAGRITNYDPITGEPITLLPPPLTPQSTGRRLSNVSATRLGRLAAIRDHRVGNWMFTGTMAAIGGGIVFGTWASLITQSGGMFLLGSAIGAFASASVVARAQSPPAMPPDMADASESEKNAYRRAYKSRTQALRMSGSFAGMLIAGATTVVIAVISF